MNLDIVLPEEPVVELAVTAVLSERKPFRGDLFVVARPMTGPPVESSTYSSNGARSLLVLRRARYQLDIRAVREPADIPATSPGRQYYSRSIIEPWNVDAGIVEVSLVPGLHLSGRVLVGSRPLGGVGIRLVPASAGPPAVLTASATTTKDGRFDADELAPGRYVLALDRDSAERWVINTVRFSGQIVNGRVIDVDQSIAPEELELTLLPKSASLSGRVIGADEATVSSYLVVLMTANNKTVAKAPSTIALARPDTTGRYLFPRQTAGSYLLFLLADPTPDDVDLLIEAAKRDASSAVPVTIPPDSAAIVDVQIRQSKR